MATQAIKEAVVELMHRFSQNIVGTTPAVVEFTQRAWAKKMAIAPGRLVDDAEKMLNKWREKGVNGSRSPLPVLIIGFDKSYSSTGLEKGISVSSTAYTVQDDLGNFFLLRLDKHDQRVQIVLFSPDHETAFSIASQFKLFCAEFSNRHLFAISQYNGVNYGFPMKMEDYQIFASSSPIAEQDNLTVFVFDLTFHCNTPYFLGDVENKAPYLSVVRTVVVDHFVQQKRHALFHQLVGEQTEGIE